MRTRSIALSRIESETFDVCVIGGGATGAGCALDAQLRGLKTVLFDAGDFASATSSASTKLVHGGVRYLRQAIAELDVGQYHVVRRALRERKLMLHNAPYLAKPLELLVPCFSNYEVLYYRIGMKLYDWISGKSLLFPSRYVSREESIRRIPALKPEGLVGSVAYADGQFDDARYDIALIQTLTECGGEALNYARIVGFEKASDGRLMAAQVQDRISHRRLTVRARAFVNATGPFSDSIRQLASPGIEQRLRPTKGVHILLPVEGFCNGDALLIPKTDDGRVIFAIPWLDRLLVGTTDDEATLQDEMVVKREEAEYLLRHLNRYLAKPLTTDQIVSGFAGLRPLVSSAGARNTKKLIRDHEVELDKGTGLISVLGGKWTTYRAMAEDATNAVQQYLGGSVAKCITRHHPLSGSQGWTPGFGEALATGYRVSPGTTRHLSEKFGAGAKKILDLAKQNSHLASPLVEGLAPIQAEIVYSIRQEMAMTIGDILARRIGLQLFDWRLAIKAAPVVGSYLAQELDWSRTQMQQAVEDYINKTNRLLQTIGLRPEHVDQEHAG